MKRIIPIIVCTLIYSFVSAQDANTDEIRNNEFGIHAGATTGIGLSYRHWFSNPGIQITLLPIKSEDLTWISTGLSYLHSFYQSRYVRVYGYVGSHMIYKKETNQVLTGAGPAYTYVEETTDDLQFNFGFGPGFSFGRPVAFNLMFGYGLYDATGSFNLLPTGEIGLYFSF